MRKFKVRWWRATSGWTPMQLGLMNFYATFLEARHPDALIKPKPWTPRIPFTMTGMKHWSDERFTNA